MSETEAEKKGVDLIGRRKFDLTEYEKIAADKRLKAEQDEKDDGKGSTVDCCAYYEHMTVLIGIMSFRLQRAWYRRRAGSAATKRTCRRCLCQRCASTI